MAENSRKDRRRARQGPGAPEQLRGGRTLAERRAMRRWALLSSALELFSTKGYSSTSVEEICRTSFVSTRNFYEEYSDKESLLTAMYDDILSRVGDTLFGARGTEEQPQDDLASAVAAVVHLLLDDPRVARVAFIESRGVSAALEQRRQSMHHLFVRWLIEHTRSSFPLAAGDELREVFALGMVGAASEVMTNWVLRDDKRPLDDLIADLNTFFAVQRGALETWAEPDRPTPPVASREHALHVGSPG